MSSMFYVRLISDNIELFTSGYGCRMYDSNVGLIHRLFVLDNLYRLNINSIDGELCLTLDKNQRKHLPFHV